MKKNILLLIFILSITIFYGQDGTVKGTIIDNSNNPIQYVNIIIQNSNTGTQSDLEGNYELKNIESGTHLLKFTFIGYKTKEITINVTDNQATIIPSIILFEGNEILQEVVVTGTEINKFSRKKSAYVSKLPLKNIENSQVYSTVTNALLTSQTVTTFEDALKNIVGIDKLWASTGRGGDGAGYYSLRGFSVQPQLVNGVPGITNGSINPSNIERIEVIKGPSATLFGSTVSSYGGLINVITKKPYKSFGGEISYTTGSFGFNKVALDVNTPLGKTDNIYFRLNTAYSTSESYQDAGFRNSFFVAPSITYQLNNKLSFSLYSEISNTEQTNPTFLFLNRTASVEWENLEDLNYDYNKSLTSNELSIKNPTSNYRLEADYKIADNWNWQSIVSSSATKSNGYYSYLWNDAGTALGQIFYPGSELNPNSRTFSLNIQKTNSRTNIYDIQQNFVGDFKIGKIRNRLLIGIDYFSKTSIDNGTGYAFVHNVNAQGEVVNYDNPNTEDLNPLTTEDIETTKNYLTKSSIDRLLANSAIGNSKIRENVFSGYLSDVINITPAISVMAGVRFDLFDYDGDLNSSDDDEEEYTQTTFSPKLGIVYQPILEKLSVFANYQNGFTNVSPEFVLSDPNNPTSERILKTFDLEEANQLEFGIKTNLFNNRLEATVSYYDILVKNKVVGFGATKNQNGEVQSKGFEIEINANPFDGLNLRGGFSKNDSKNTKNPSQPELVGIRYEGAGPDVLYNFWANYQFQQGAVKGFGLGFGFNGASEQDIMIGYPLLGDFILPSYTIFNQSIFYQGEKFRIGLKLNNLTNEKYYKGWSTINPQQPRTLLADFTYKF